MLKNSFFNLPTYWFQMLIKRQKTIENRNGSNENDIIYI